MTDYDRIQNDLVIQSEKPHEFGLRQKGISGTICSWLLRDFLRKEFSHVRFDEGTICSASKKGLYKSDQFSPQCDIIAYRGSSWERLYEYVVVPVKNVFFTVEVKKWISKGDVAHKEKRVNLQLKRLKDFTNKPICLVAYRTSSNVPNLKSGSIADHTYVFSKGTPEYPDYTEDFETSYVVKGELQRLVSNVRTIVK